MRAGLFLMSRQFELIESQLAIKIVNGALQALVFIFFSLPIMTLGVWGGALIVMQRGGETSMGGGIALVLFVQSIILFWFGLSKLYWNKFHFSWEVTTLLSFSFASFVAYQLFIILFDTSYGSFFGYSAIFLNCNVVPVLFLIFLNTGKNGASIKEFISNKLPLGEPLDASDKTKFAKEIKEQRLDRNFVPSFQEVQNMFTAIVTDEGSVMTAFGGGFQYAYRNLGSGCKKFIIEAALYGFAVGVLVIYAFIVYWDQNRSRLGFVILVVVLIGDFILYLIYLSRVVESALFLTITAIINRFLLIILGTDYWIYGEMLLYLYYITVLIVLIGKKRFPYEEAYDKADLIAAVTSSKHKVDVAKVPEFLLGLINLIVLSLFALLVLLTPRGVPLPPVQIGLHTFPFYIVALFITVLQIPIASIVMMIRIFFRKQKQMENNVIYYFKCLSFDLHWMFSFSSFLGLSILGLLSYWFTSNLSFFIVAAFGALYFIFLVNGLLHYVMNDYNVFQDIKNINRKIDLHNNKVAALEKQARLIKDQIKSGGDRAKLGVGELISKTPVSGLSQIQLQKPQLPIQTASQKKSNPKGLVQQQHNQNMKTSYPTNSLKSLQPYQQSSHEDDLDNIIQEELKAQKLQLEGGEKESTTIKQVAQPQKQQQNISVIADQSTNRLNAFQVDMDIQLNEAEIQMKDEEEESDALIKNQKLSRVVDWREDLKMNACGAFWRGKLRSNDYQIIISLLFCFLSVCLLGFLVTYIQQDYIGVTIAIPLLHYALAIFSQLRMLNTVASLSVLETLVFIFAYFIQYGWGVAYLYLEFKVISLKPGENAVGGLYLVVYLILLPFITSLTFTVMKWIDTPKVTKMFALQFVITLLQGVALLVCAFLFLHLETGIIISAIIGFVLYLCFQGWILQHNDYYMPMSWKVINIILVTLIVMAPIVLGIVLPQLLTFVGFSLSVFSLSFFLLLYSFASIYGDLNRINERPIFYSPMIFPVYRFNPKTNDIEGRNGPAGAMFVGVGLMIVWSGFCTAWVDPIFIGVSLGILFELIMIVSVLYIVNITQLELKENLESIDHMIIRLAWLDAKQAYVKQKNAACRADLLTYAKAVARRNHLKNYIRILSNRSSLSIDEILNHIKLEAVSEADLGWMDLSQEEMRNKVALYGKLFEVEKEVSSAYVGELELIIQFLLLILQQAESIRAVQRKTLFNVIVENKPALIAKDIVIHIPTRGSMKVRYARVVGQIQHLSPEKQLFFNSLRDSYVEQQRIIDEQRRELAAEDELKDQERQKNLELMSDENRKLIEELKNNPDMPASQMPDCEIKWKKILTDGLKFVDPKFDHQNQEIMLGANHAQYGITGWVSISEMDQPHKYSLYIGEASPFDVQQGVFGDCYFMSAISVIGSKYIQDSVIITKENEWRENGSFCVRFFKGGEPEYVIVDDYFPVNQLNKFICATGGQEGFELWPAVLEKAYAKMYGNYSMIECGKVQNALADLTNGFPDCISLEESGKNDKMLWEKLKMCFKRKDLLGAGSYNHPNGDSHVNANGIVASHAYAILQIFEDGPDRLIQLRNPHGVRSTTAEWKGDWCDSSEKWTPRVRNLLNWQVKQWADDEEETNDGVFWMDVEDFGLQFANLYICRTCEGWKKFRIEDEWIGASAQGLPNSKNSCANPDFSLIPQYEVTINKPCEGFIAVQQVKAKNTYFGVTSTFFACLKLSGNPIKKKEQMNKDTLLMKSEVTNLLVNASECDFNRTVSYPYKFTLLVTNILCAKDGGEGAFIIKLYSTDEKMTVRRINPVAQESHIEEIV